MLTTGSRYTPVHFGAMNGHAEIVKLLLEHTEDSSAIEACDIDGSSPLALAVANGHRELAKILVENGSGLDTADKLGMTPIFRAVCNNLQKLYVNELAQKLSGHISTLP